MEPAAEGYRILEEKYRSSEKEIKESEEYWTGKIPKEKWEFLEQLRVEMLQAWDKWNRFCLEWFDVLEEE